MSVFSGAQMRQWLPKPGADVIVNVGADGQNATQVSELVNSLQFDTLPVMIFGAVIVSRRSITWAISDRQ